MLFRLYISRNWIVSSTARRVYLVASICSLSLIGSLIAIAMAISGTGRTFAEVNAATVVVVYALLLIGVVWAAILRVAMLYYWYGFDLSGSGAKLFWLVGMLLFGPFAEIVYHFAVYRRRTGSSLSRSSRVTSLAS